MVSEVQLDCISGALVFTKEVQTIVLPKLINLQRQYFNAVIIGVISSLLKVKGRIEYFL